MIRRISIACLTIIGLVHAQPAAAATCDSLASLPLQNAHITSAQMVAAGAFTPPAAPGGGAAAAGRGAGRGNAPNPYAMLPAFCRVAAMLMPSSDSDIRIDVWLPDTAGWNGKFQAVGNGGWAGTIAYPAMAAALRSGYATTSTDTGHVGNSASFALGHPEKVIDIGYRAIHEMTVQGKAIVNGYYSSAPKFSYFNGCSLGGRQGITEAQRYPADFDGIVAGAVAWGGMDRFVGVLMNNGAMQKTPGAYIPPEKYPAVHDAVLQACDGMDGVEDGILENPLACHFDPKVLQCKAGEDTASCLTAAQVQTATMIYAPAKDPKTGKVLTGGLMPGTELQWGTLYGPAPYGNAAEPLKYIVMKDANWDAGAFNPATDIEKAQKADPDGVLNSDNPNIKAFFDRGGKLLMYQGFADPQVPSDNAIRYHQMVLDTVGRSVEGTSIELFMVPGMYHCQGGPGTDTFNKMAAIEQWVEQGTAPDRIVASHMTDGKADRTRPLCVFPKVAKWNGTGSTDDAANFSCVAESASRSTR
ncbi:MAG: tannase/feruloyl esterase family alpha/beta hydrolase [Acidobacteria bacterium]|nr:tannase/feruloyl esterase family alpha/beta hydrolase [Acidobacteriota bacterium]